MLLEKYPLGWQISTRHCWARSWQCQNENTTLALFLKEEYFYFHKWCTILIKMAQKYSLPVTPSSPSPPFFFICIPVPWIQYFRYIFHSVTSWFKMFAQDNSEPCQIHVTYFIFQVNCRLSFMSCSSKYSDMQEVVPVNSVPCH